MARHSFSQLITSYFIHYLPERSGYSENTIKAYRDTFILLFRYQKTMARKSLNDLSFENVNRHYVEDFLNWLGSQNQYSATSMNQRLAGIHSFCRYVLSEAPEYMEPCTAILDIKMKKVPAKPMTYLSAEAMKILLKMPDTSCENGRRDLAMLSLLYDSGARVQEIADLNLGNVREKKPAIITLKGKGNKTRVVPLMPQTLEILLAYTKDCDSYKVDSTNPLFFNKQGIRLTRAGISYVLDKYVNLAREHSPELYPDSISPHTLRHSKAMHLLEGGVNLIYIRDFLGHASVVTTEIYAKSNPEIKRKAIENASPRVLPEERYTSKQKQDLMKWLKSLV